MAAAKIEKCVDELITLREKIGADRPFFTKGKVVANASTQLKKEAQASGRSKPKKEVLPCREEPFALSNL